MGGKDQLNLRPVWKCGKACLYSLSQSLNIKGMAEKPVDAGLIEPDSGLGDGPIQFVDAGARCAPGVVWVEGKCYNPGNSLLPDDCKCLPGRGPRVAHRRVTAEFRSEPCFKRRRLGLGQLPDR